MIARPPSRTSISPETGWKAFRALALSLAAGVGCSGPTVPAAPAVTAEVRCDACGLILARSDAQPRINLDGIDVFACKKCPAPSRRSPRPRVGSTAAGRAAAGRYP